MPADAGAALTDLLARVRVAVLALAPDEADPAASSEPTGFADGVAHALGVIADLQAALQDGEDTLRTLLVADMGLAVARIHEATPAARGSIVALLAQAVSVLANEPPEDASGSLPSA